MADIETAKRYFFEAVALLDKGDFATGTLRLRDALRFAPDNISILTNLAGALMIGGEFAEARRMAERVIACDARNLPALLIAAECLTRDGRPAETVSVLDTIIALEPQVAQHHSNRSAALNRLKRYEEALASADRAIALSPGLAAAHLNRGNSLADLRRNNSALAAYERGAALDPGLAEAWLGRGILLARARRTEEALESFERALALAPGMTDAVLGRGDALAEFNRHRDALAAYDRALELNPNHACAWLGRGNSLAALDRDEEASAAYDRGLEGDSTLASAWFGRGNILAKLNRHEEAFAAFDRAFELAPDEKFFGGHRLHAKTMICDWSNWDAECAAMISGVKRGALVANPLVLLALTSSAADQLQCARTFVHGGLPTSPSRQVPQRHRRDERVHIAYLSADFRAHPVSVLAAGLFECHDRARFRTTAISFGPDSHDAMRGRIKAAFEEFIDIDKMSDIDAAARIRERGVDIAIDLMGYTRGFRTGIMARRAAPIQVNYLGFAATMGADFIDYILADRHAIPEEQRAAYAEKVVDLPDSFQANDRKRPIPGSMPGRREAGLPETGLVFCCFNQSFKITPDVFDVWMRLLRAIDGSVAWIAQSNPAALRNLRGEAVRRGVAAERIVVAPRVAAYQDHLARLRLADLFLDTFPYNAHTTASDMLWAGVPVVTCAGASFASRVATSLLHAAGVPELATGSLDEYEALALLLARDPERLAAVKARLAANRTTCALFDTARFCRHLEAAFTTMYDRHRRGEPPASFAVAAIGPDGA